MSTSALFIFSLFGRCQMSSWRVYLAHTFTTRCAPIRTRRRDLAQKGHLIVPFPHVRSVDAVAENRNVLPRRMPKPLKGNGNHSPSFSKTTCNERPQNVLRCRCYVSHPYFFPQLRQRRYRDYRERQRSAMEDGIPIKGKADDNYSVVLVLA